MSKTPQRLSSIATPTRDKIVIYSTIAAGCGILALLGRHAAINSFGTDHFTDNVLFIVFLILTIGLFVGFQSMIEEIFRKLPNPFRRQEIAIAETNSDDQVSVPITEGTVDDVMEFYSPSYYECTSEPEITEDVEYLTLEDGTQIRISDIDIDDVVFDNLEDNIREYDSLQERH